MSGKVALSIEGLKVRYGPIEALKGINIEVQEGSVVALLGANGAGKTTTLQTISGLVNAAEGKISFYGKDITNKEAESIASLGISQSPEGRQIFADLTVDENLKAGSFTLRDKKIIDNCYRRVYKHFPLLKERGKQLAGTLSGGELQMLAIARALMSNPKILLLDEPSLGLAPLIVQDIFKIIGEIKKEGTTVVIVEQNALQTLKIADYGYVLDLGKINISGEASALIKDERLIEAYLGTK
ncbi:MAG: ABC transporter ATP-binding protein [Clostridia bacterium]|nr:ABC transporter ATP-binding protein [Clostridia bacterium]